jgi:hypothetical protein
MPRLRPFFYQGAMMTHLSVRSALKPAPTPELPTSVARTVRDVLKSPLAATAHSHEKAAADEETLVPDSRASLTPAEAVERRLTVMLRGVAMPVSHVRMAKFAKGNPPVE